MWLLNVHTREMKEFISHKQIPPYAILSHTWGDEEVSFNDWQYKPREHVERKAGYKKIDKCCQQAIADGLNWVWVDTCCIDKSSSAELSEAINSMFRWYRNANVCYAYLCDVFDDFESNLAGCHWITRGWTLQELIAPSKVVFYSSEWKTFGTRSTLLSHLATATGIDKSFLAGRSLDEASIAQRMSWAAKRQTSREEDEAYCLLGIFDVNMSLIYGEGSKAFRRLQEILVREYPEDHSLFAWGKIVKRLSNQVDDDEEIRGSKPIGYNHKEVGIKYFGLLAEGPEDFQYSGHVVCAPQARNYFQYLSTVSVSALNGRTARIELPVGDTIDYVSIHLKRLPTVQLHEVDYLVLLCGCQDDSRTDFYFITIPIITHTAECSRLEEIVISDTYTQAKLTPNDLRSRVNRYSIAPMLPLYPPSGSIVIRRHVEEISAWHIISSSEIDFSFISGSVKVPSSTKNGLFSITYDTEDELGLMIVAVRLDALDHLHEDPTQARNCGRLSFRIQPFAILKHGNPELKMINYDNQHATQEKFSLMSFPTISEARDYSYSEWRQMKYKHDMVQPRDEWRISAIGLADVFISVERFFFEDNDNSNDNESHPFVDVLDIVVEANTEETGSQRKRNILERVRKHMRRKY
ncbi:HET-domain-containing protein [Xylaria scruposa]|nr:HET-domain-containing protein [Xylaria scruposa]